MFICVLTNCTRVCTFFFFFLMVLPPPRSTLFPYTTLFRSIIARRVLQQNLQGERRGARQTGALPGDSDRKSTRLNSSHTVISYAVFCLKKKKEARLTSHRHPQTTPTVTPPPRSASTKPPTH